MIDEYALIRQIQEFFGLGAKPFFWVFNTLWGLGLSTLLPAMIFWLGGREMGFRAGLFTDFSGVTNEYSKWLIAEPRPFYVSEAFTPLKVSTGFGMPSGNAQGIATLMGTISLYAKRKWVWIVAALMIFFTGLARIYYGIHSPSQVLVGWILGLLIAFLLFKFAGTFVGWFRPRSMGFQLGSVLVLAVLATLIGLMIDYLVLQNFVIPDAWIERYNEIAVATDEEDPFELFSANSSYAIGAYLFGLLFAGVFLLRDLIPEIETTPGKILNVVLGLGLFYGVGQISGLAIAPLRGTYAFWPYLMIVWALNPLLIYTITPLLSNRILHLTELRSQTVNDLPKSDE